MFSTIITLNEKSVDIVIDALAKKKEQIEDFIVVTGVCNDRIKKDYTDCYETLDMFKSIKENFNIAKMMAMEK